MKLNDTPLENKDAIQIAHTDKNVCTLLSNKLLSWMPTSTLPRDYVVLCIGTDRSTGDSLGPLTGTFFNEHLPTYITTYGTLNEPVHAKNLQEFIHTIHKKHTRPFIIAIDACLGKHYSIGSFIAGTGGIKPGAALKKTLPSVGNIHLTGVVNLGGFMEFSVLQNTRLSIVVEMAKKLAITLKEVDDALYKDKVLSTIKKRRFPITYKV